MYTPGHPSTAGIDQNLSCTLGDWLTSTCMYMYIQYRSDARYNERAFAFACNRVRLRVRTRSPPLANAFVSEFERVRFSSQTRSPPPTNAFASPNERKCKRLFRWRLTVASTRLALAATLISRSTVTLYVFLIMCGSKVINNLVGAYRVVRVRLLHRANAFVWTAQTRFVERANAFW